MGVAFIDYLFDATHSLLSDFKSVQSVDSYGIVPFPSYNQILSGCLRKQFRESIVDKLLQLIFRSLSRIFLVYLAIKVRLQCRVSLHLGTSKHASRFQSLSFRTNLCFFADLFVHSAIHMGNPNVVILFEVRSDEIPCWGQFLTVACR